MTRGFEYSDCWVDDARLVVLNVRDAANRGADVRTRMTVTGFARTRDHWRISALTADGMAHEFTALSVVNAGGPQVVAVQALSPEKPDRTVRLVRGSHIVVPRLFDHAYPYFFQLGDGRIFFAIPYERDFTLIGTTDADHDPAVDAMCASTAEIAYLCSGASEFFRVPITPAQVVWSYAGVRPLVDDGKGRPEAASRGYQLHIDRGDDARGDQGTGAPLLTVYGGKITTYRHLAMSAVDKLQPLIPALSGGDWTGTAALPGGDFAVNGVTTLMAAMAARYPFLAPATIDRMVRAYGTDMAVILGDATSLDALGQQFGHALTEAEVRHLWLNEWARSAEDVLWRRTKLGLKFDAAQTATLAAWFAGRNS